MSPKSWHTLLTYIGVPHEEIAGQNTEVRIMSIHECPRCGTHKLEYLTSYSFCWECGYSAQAAESCVPLFMRVGNWISKKADEGREISRRLEEQKRIHDERVQRVSPFGF